jgi:high affinity Mn2+ porin
VIRVLAFTNFANMGDYHDAIDQFEENRSTMRTPNIDAHPYNTTLKHGFGLNMEQELTEDVRLFMRAGWNEGQHESWAYTEVDQTLSFGGDIRGDWWRRPKDKWGVALVANGISAPSSAILGARRTGLPAGRWKLVRWPARDHGDLLQLSGATQTRGLRGI